MLTLARGERAPVGERDVRNLVHERECARECLLASVCKRECACPRIRASACPVGAQCAQDGHAFDAAVRATALMQQRLAKAVASPNLKASCYRRPPVESGLYAQVHAVVRVDGARCARHLRRVIHKKAACLVVAVLISLTPAPVQDKADAQRDCYLDKQNIVRKFSKPLTCLPIKKIMELPL
eukprot:6196534-Pleurochrysis_carterae.AAC.4